MQRLPYNYMFCQGYVIQEDAYILEKRLSGALSLAIRNFANSKLTKRQGNDRCLSGCIYSPRLRGKFACLGRYCGYYNTFGVGFCVARSMVSGQCEGLE